MRDTVKIIRESGAIEELTDAVKEATMAARDTFKRDKRDSKSVERTWCYPRYC